jgi:class 3 adenylate cyclase
MPSSDLSKKKLKAIVFTDIANFTKLSAQDEQKALDLIQHQNEIIKPIVEKHNGEWLKEIGDGLLLSFDSSLDAVQCSIQIQEALRNEDDLDLRIGIHQGDIFIKDGDVYGDDVNVASRIEPFSAIGGIAISDKVQRDISSTPKYTTKYIGQPKLKGVQQEVKVYCITSHGLPETNLSDVSAKLEKKTNWFKYVVSAVAVVALLTYYFIPKGKEVDLLYYDGHPKKS